MTSPWYVLLTAGGEERRLPCTDPGEARRRYPFLPAGPLVLITPAGERVEEPREEPREERVEATSEDCSQVASPPAPPPLPPAPAPPLPPPPPSGERKLTRGQLLHRERMARKARGG